MLDLSLTRQPVAYVEILKLVLVAVAVFADLGLTADTQALIIAAVYAVLGAIQAAAVRPIAPAAFVTVITTLAALAGRFGLELGPEQVAAIVGLASGILTLQTWQSVTPTLKPAAA